MRTRPRASCRARKRGAQYLFCVLVTAVPLLLQSVAALAADPVLDMFGFDLDSSADDLRDWVADEGLKATETNTPRAEAYVREGLSGLGIGFAPARNGLDVLFVNQSGITTPVGEVVSRIEAAYGEPDERDMSDGAYRLKYVLRDSGKPGQMVWLVRRGFVGVELSSNAYLSASESGEPLFFEEALRSLWEWRMAFLGTIGGGIALYLLFRALPPRARRFVSNVLQAVFYPIVQALGFLGSRLFTLFFGIILIPLFVFSGCAAIASAVEQGTSWLWVITWGIGVLLALESRDSDEFRYVIIADLLFIVTSVGVVLQMMYIGNA